jgi:hypothetical protein
MNIEQKIYYQDNNMLIGSKVWEFVGKDSNNSLQTRKKTIPVSAISSVDFVYYPRWIFHIITFLGVVAIVLPLVLSGGHFWGSWRMYTFFFAGIPLLILGCSLYNKHKGIGSIKVITNNSLSSYSYDGLCDSEADKYLEPMRKCLLEKES